MEDDHDEEEMDDFNLEYERECHWSMVFGDNGGGVDNKKVLLHANRWYLHVNEK